jgi:hypothetical protein
MVWKRRTQRQEADDAGDTLALSRPSVYLLRMGVFLAVVALVSILLAGPLAKAFVANLAINGVILGALLIGILYTIARVVRLGPEVSWVNAFRRGEPGLATPGGTALMAPMAALLRDRTGPMTLSPVATRSILDSVGARLDESRDISRYMIGLLIFLGLLGTFWGLLETIGSVGETIGALNVDGGTPEAMFETLKRGLEAPLGGMGTAFSSSLFGLAGSLVVGFLDLQAAQAQNRFYNEFEEWLSTVTRLGGGTVPAAIAEGETSVPAYVTALLEQTADNLDALQRTMAKSAEDRARVDQRLSELSQRLATFGDLMRVEQKLLVKLAEGHNELQPVLERMTRALEATGGGDDATLAHLRSLDLTLGKILEETTGGRAELIQELRNEIKLLSRTMAAVAGSSPGGGAA